MKTETAFNDIDEHASALCHSVEQAELRAMRIENVTATNGNYKCRMDFYDGKQSNGFSHTRDFA